MSNVLPLFWHLASSSRDTRLGASADLVSAIEGFQASFSGGAPQEEQDEDEDDDEDDDDESEDGKMEVDGEEEDDDDEDDEEDEEAAALDAALARDNAPDVVYSVKRLVRGLGSSRESSRLGFAVALTELLARTPSVSAAQVLSLVFRASHWAKGMKGSEERDAMFARLFGIVAVADSGALFAQASRLDDFKAVLESLLALTEAKAWLAESAGWALVRVVDAFIASDVEWKDEAVTFMTERLYKGKHWSPEKIAVTIKLQAAFPDLDWKALTAPTFKTAPLLSSQNLVTLGRVLKEGGDDAPATGNYKPQLHFVWDAILASYPSTSSAQAPFADLFRVVVDEALFANTSSAERKYWGFQVFERALPLLDAEQVPLVFTPNFMRCWMNNLSAPDRHLYKAAQQTARVVQEHVKANPAAGFTLLSQLVGKHGRPDFDKATKTKTVESIMAALSAEGVEAYVEYLEKAVIAPTGEDTEEKRQWAMDQMLALARNGAVPKTDAWVGKVLDVLLVAGFFIVRKADKKINALKTVPKPTFSDASALVARQRLFSVLVEITTSKEDKESKVADASGKWLARTLETLAQLEKNKHVELVSDADDEIKALRASAHEVLATLGKHDSEVARGAQILVSFLILQTYDEVEDALDMLEEAVSAAKGMFGNQAAEEEPVDELLDVLVALLDKGSADLRMLANLVFGMVSGAMTQSGIEHLVAQLESTGGAEGEDAEMDGEEDEEDEEDGEDEDDGSDEEEDEDDNDSDASESDDDGSAAVDPEFRRRVAEALKVSGALDDASDVDADSDDESVWDDEQMLAIDEQLAAVFEQRSTPSSKKSDLKHAAIESLHFKNRVLDFFDTYARKQASSPLVLLLLIPLLRLSRVGGELGNKAAGVLKTRIAKAKEHPTADAAKVMSEIHELAQHAPSAEFSSLCASAALFCARADPSSAAAAYAKTLEDFMTRKASGVHPNFLAEYVKRYPARGWALAPRLVQLCAPGTAANAFRQAQGYSLFQSLLSHLPALIKGGEVALSDAEKVLGEVMGGVYATLEAAAAEGAKADRLKDVGKFALALARAAAGMSGAERARAICDAARLESVLETVKSGRTKEMKGVIGLLVQLAAVLRKEGKGKRAREDKPAKIAKAEAGEINGEPKAKKRKADGKKANGKGKKAKAAA